MDSNPMYLSKTGADEVEPTDDAAQDPPSPTSSDEWPKSTSSTEPPLLSVPTPPRIKPLTYSEAVEKGRKLLNLMQAPPSSEAKTSFTSCSLEKWGYITTTRRIPRFHTHHAPGYSLNTIEVKSTHSASVITDAGTTIPATDATFANIFVTRTGTIIAFENFGPAHTHPTLGDGEGYPALKHWSDIVSLQLQIATDLQLDTDIFTVPRFHTATESNIDADANTSNDIVTEPPPNTAHATPYPKVGLEHIVRQDIENPHTNALIHDIMQMHVTGQCSYNIEGAACPYCNIYFAWPGLTFAMHTEEAIALLGSPNGRGVAWLLAQLGQQGVRRTVGTVTVWCEQDKVPSRPNLLFWVEEVGEGGGGEEGSETIPS